MECFAICVSSTFCQTFMFKFHGKRNSVSSDYLCIFFSPKSRVLCGYSIWSSSRPCFPFLPSLPLPGLCTVSSSPCFPGYFSIATLFSLLLLLSFLYSLFIFSFLLVLWELATAYFGHNIPFPLQSPPFSSFFFDS